MKMKKLITIFIFYLFCTSAFSQKYEIIEEVIEDNTENIISKTKAYKYSGPTELLNLFYENQHSFKAIEPLLSHRMFEVTPSDKFKDLLNAKNTVCGKYIDRVIVNSEYFENDHILMYDIKVEYEKLNTLEKVYLVRERITDEFKIGQYMIQEDD